MADKKSSKPKSTEKKKETDPTTKNKGDASKPKAGSQVSPRKTKGDEKSPKTSSRKSEEKGSHTKSPKSSSTTKSKPNKSKPTPPPSKLPVRHVDNMTKSSSSSSSSDKPSVPVTPTEIIHPPVAPKTVVAPDGRTKSLRSEKSRKFVEPYIACGVRPKFYRKKDEDIFQPVIDYGPRPNVHTLSPRPSGSPRPSPRLQPDDNAKSGTSEDDHVTVVVKKAGKHHGSQSDSSSSEHSKKLKPKKPTENNHTTHTLTKSADDTQILLKKDTGSKPPSKVSTPRDKSGSSSSDSDEKVVETKPVETPIETPAIQVTEPSSSSSSSSHDEQVHHHIPTQPEPVLVPVLVPEPTQPEPVVVPDVPVLQPVSVPEPEPVSTQLASKSSSSSSSSSEESVPEVTPLPITQHIQTPEPVAPQVTSPEPVAHPTTQPVTQPATQHTTQAKKSSSSSSSSSDEDRKSAPVTPQKPKSTPTPGYENPMASPLSFWKTKEQSTITSSDPQHSSNVTKAQSVREKLAAIVRKGNEDERKRAELYKTPLSPRKPNTPKAMDGEEAAKKEKERLEAEAKREQERLQFEIWEAERKKKMHHEGDSIFTPVKSKSKSKSSSSSSSESKDDVLEEQLKREELRLMRAFSTRK